MENLDFGLKGEEANTSSFDFEATFGGLYS
jgi:hypothetical protein